ncbi:protein LAZY 1-like [Lotus japonicus]|uniref:protein LAZY 1-like n=1 Tax=Lotus japonicus TaxID=34305 RepID=UPI002587221F|nr:protein LAZY 1-like [Lotus japonicus]
MKLLGWMHRKFRQNSTEPFKDHLVIGKAGHEIDERSYHLKPNFGSKHVQQIEKEHSLRKSFSGQEAADARVEDDEYVYEEDGAMYELFHGFLAIGTLGLGCSTDPSATPTFGNICVENIITEKEDEVTENELKLINDELEKVLGDDECINSARNSHVSSSTAGRSSHGSMISLSGKPMNMMEGNSGNIGTSSICPLQGYLFGSASIELPKVVPAKSRTSLGELFQRSKLADQEINEKGDKISEKEDKSALHLVRKKLKKKILLHTCSRNSSSNNGGPVDSANSADTKLRKILHMFHRKVHPENSAAEPKNECKKKTINVDGGHNKFEALVPKESNKSQSNPVLQFSLGIEDSSENREHWIKTDSDYLVLEL